MSIKPFIKNEPTGWCLSACDVPAPMAPMQKGPSPIQIRITGATAEWVTERPTEFGADKLYELADYHRVEFQECHAIAASAPSAASVVQLPPGARLINMREVRNHPWRSVKASVAKRLDEQTLETVYR